jgi:hypothetical protein
MNEITSEQAAVAMVTHKEARYLHGDDTPETRHATVSALGVAYDARTVLAIVRYMRDDALAGEYRESARRWALMIPIAGERYTAAQASK